MERIRSGESEGIVVADVGRLSRLGLGDAIKLVEDIRAVGGKVGFADLDIDTVTPEGEAMLNIWPSIKRMEWRNYEKKFLTARSWAIDRGVMVGPAPPGYLKEPGDRKDTTGPLYVDESTRDGYERAFAVGTRRAARASAAPPAPPLAAWTRTRSQDRTAPGPPWSRGPGRGSCPGFRSASSRCGSRGAPDAAAAPRRRSLESVDLGSVHAVIEEQRGGA
jgi:hypothetical protein